MKVRVACCSLIYRKTLKLTRTALGETTIGQAVNLLSNDVNRFDISIIFLHYLWLEPLESIIITYITFHLIDIGISSIFGIAFLLMFIPFQVWLGKNSSELKLRTAVRTDERINLARAVYADADIYIMDDPLSAHVGKHIFEKCCTWRAAFRKWFFGFPSVFHSVHVEPIFPSSGSFPWVSNVWRRLLVSHSIDPRVVVEFERHPHPTMLAIRCLQTFSVVFHVLRLSTILAFGAEAILTKEFDNYQDIHSSAWYIFISTLRAFGFWLDVFCVLTRNSTDLAKLSHQNFINNFNAKYKAETNEVTIYITFLVITNVIVTMLLHHSFMQSCYLGTVLIGIAFYYMRIFYLSTSRTIKRLEGIAYSPIFTHLSTTLQGLPTIRTFGAVAILRKEFDDHQGIHSSAWCIFIASSLAFGLWLNAFCVLYIAMEFDHPHVLLQKKNLKSIVQETGKAMAEVLASVAHDRYQNRGFTVF
ncbi:hypothetical protein ALC57_01233 [Trachymyrmex cornetzi]|uniref:ABC transmembrane type-1 domain-containing protein n=1 Tax=Trachymyrmex cornetzi TaxID=471704 RepID=A0A151JQ51_9HYME|nr:hypothetical protein ALC57_01233 [Trachymyrmex cornetzi]